MAYDVHTSKQTWEKLKLKALDRKKWRYLIRGGKGNSNEGSTDNEGRVFLFDLVPDHRVVLERGHW